MSPPIIREDPYSGLSFEVTLLGVSEASKEPKGSFAEVSGLEVEVEVIEYRNGSEDRTVRKLPGLAKYPNITLKRGLTGDAEFWNWMLSGVRGNVQRVDGVIALLNEEREQVMRFTFRRGWPCKWAGPELNAQGNEVAIETLVICHEGLELDD